MKVLGKLRRERGLTQKQVAEQLTKQWKDCKDKYGPHRVVTTAIYGFWERGEREPPTEAIVPLADFYNCSTDYLLGVADTRSLRPVSVLEELGLERESWWEIRRETTHDERVCAKVFAWIASGKSIKDVLAKNNDESWRSSRWGERQDLNTVQSMLIRSIDDGVVDIIAEEIPQDEELIEAVRSSFPFLQEVKVVKTSSQNGVLVKILVGEVAALFFDSIVRPGHSVGLSGGTTLARVAAALKKYPCSGIKLYPFDNGLLPETVDVCANTLIGQIKYSHPASYIVALALQYLAIDESYRPFKFPPNHPSVLRVLSGAQNVDVGFVGLGAVTPDYLRDNNPALAAVFNALRITVDDLVKKDAAVGNILFHCFREDGTYIDNRLNKRIGSVKPERLRELAESGKPIVGVACGAMKGKAGLGLLNGRYVNNLVIDDKLADAILEAKKLFVKKNSWQG